MKAAALRGALSDRARAGRLHVVTALVDRREAVDQGRPHRARRRHGPRSALLVVLDRGRRAGLAVACATCPSVHIARADQLNTYDVLVNDDVVFTKDAYDAFVAGPARGQSVKASARSGEVTEGSDEK